MTTPELQGELGLVTRAQALADGMTDETIEWRLESGRWQRLHPGVYIARPGPVSWLTRAAAVVLACGTGAVLADQSAAYLHRLVDEPGPIVCVAIPAARRLVPPCGARVRRSRGLQPFGVSWPPRTSVEATIVDMAAHSSADDIASWLARALSRQMTTPDRLLHELARRRRHAQRTLVAGMICDVRDGHESTLEIRFVRDVLRRHGLPLGTAQFPLGAIDPELAGRRADRGYAPLRLLIELDGVRFHQGPALVDDRFKSNRAAAAGWIGVRFGWPETVGRPCRTAAELAQLFWARGWTGTPRGCSPQCPVATLQRNRPA